MEGKTSAVMHNNYMMKKLGVKPEIIAMVEKEEKPLVYGWMYLCAIDGMPEDQMKILSEFPDTDPARKIEDIRSRRLKFLSEKFGNNIGLNRKIDEMEKTVEKVSRDANETIDRFHKINAERIADLRGQIQLTERLMSATIEEKEKTIQDKAERIRMLEEEVRELQSKLKESEDRKTAEQEEAEQTNRECMDKLDTISYDYSPLRSFLRRWKREDKKFIEKYLEDDRYSEEQREFLLKCFEAGMSVKELEQFASPGIDVGLMKRLMATMYRNSVRNKKVE